MNSDLGSQSTVATQPTNKTRHRAPTTPLRACPLFEYLDGDVAETYLDIESSGNKRNRPGLKRLLVDVREGNIDIIVCGALDRPARDGADVSWIGKKLEFGRVKLCTILKNEIDENKFAVASLLGSIYLANLQQKTLRGMEAAILTGRFACGRDYGYRNVHQIGPPANPLRASWR